MKLKERFYNFRYIIAFFEKRTKKLIIYNMFYVIVAGVLPICSLFITKSIMNILVSEIKSKLDILIFGAIILAFINIILKIFSYINSFVENINSLVFFEQFEIKVFQKMKDIPLKYFADPEFNDLCKKLYLGENTNCTTIISEFFIIIQLAISTLIYIVSLLKTNISNGEKYLIIISSILALLFRRFFLKRQEILTINNNEKITPLRRKLDTFKKIFFSPIVQDELRTYNAQKFFIDTINDVNKKIFLMDKQIKYKIHNYNRVGAIGVYILQRLVYIVLLNDVFKNRIGYGEFVLIVGAVEGIFASIIQISMNISSLWENLYAVNYLKDFFSLEERNIKCKNSVLLDNDVETIEFVHVSFKYPNTKEYVLKDVSFKIQKGEKVGIIGVNGSGKTTILKIIMKLYDVEQGEVLINGININEINISFLYKQLGVVFQDYCKYSLSIKEFIMLGDDESTKNLKRLQQIIKELDIDTFINSLPEGIDTLLIKEFSNGSIELSEGQWQKIVIARAFYNNKSFLILDEASAFLDVISEKKLFKLVYKEMTNKTVIFISHNLSNVKNCDNILLIDMGKIICQGKHQDLMKNSNVYNYLYNSQAHRYGKESI